MFLWPVVKVRFYVPVKKFDIGQQFSRDMCAYMEKTCMTTELREPLSVRGPAALPGNQLTICTERSLELPHSFSLVYFCTRVK